MEIPGGRGEHLQMGVKHEKKTSMGEEVGYFSGLTHFIPGLLSAFYTTVFTCFIHVHTLTVEGVR